MGVDQQAREPGIEGEVETDEGQGAGHAVGAQTLAGLEAFHLSYQGLVEGGGYAGATGLRQRGGQGLAQPGDGGAALAEFKLALIGGGRAPEQLVVTGPERQEFVHRHPALLAADDEGAGVAFQLDQQHRVGPGLAAQLQDDGLVVAAQELHVAAAGQAAQAEAFGETAGGEAGDGL